MGFYVNAYAKKDCYKQINSLWKKQFGGFLIYTDYRVKKEIEYMHKNDQCLFIKSVKNWNDNFSILAVGRGQVFLRAFGYDELRIEEFKKENNELKEKVQFLLDNRFLFEKITGLQDAVDTLDMNINCDYIENGRNKNYEFNSFDKLPQHHNDMVFNKCLQINNPDLWANYLEIKKEGLSPFFWDKTKHIIIDKNIGFGETLLQRFVKYQKVCFNNSLELEDDNCPDILTLHRLIVSSHDDFESFLSRLNHVKDKMIS